MGRFQTIARFLAVPLIAVIFFSTFTIGVAQAGLVATDDIAQENELSAQRDQVLAYMCQRRSKSTPLAGVKMHHLMRFSPALAVVPVVHRRDPRCFV